MRTVYDYGATGDGIADDTAAFRAAASDYSLNAPASRPAGGAAVYRITGTITVPGGTVVIDGTVDATGMPAATTFDGQPAFRATGSLGTPIAMTEALYLQQRVITRPNALNVGQLVFLSNGERPVPGMTRTDRSKGELKRILEASPDRVQFSSGTYFSYQTPASMAPVNSIRVAFTGTGEIRCGGIGSGHTGIFIKYGHRPVVQGLMITGAEDVGVNFDYCWTPYASNVQVDGSTSPSFGSTGYGILLGAGTTGGYVTGCTLFNCRHGIAGGGKHPTMFSTVDRCFADDALLDSHEPTFEWQFFGNTILGGNDGMLLRGQEADAVMNRFFNQNGGSIRIKTWDGVTVQAGMRSILNRIRSSWNGIQADGRAAAPEPISHKQGLVLWGDRVENAGRSTGSAVTVAHATEASVDVFTQWNRGEVGVEVDQSRLRSLEFQASDATVPLRFTNSSIADDD